MLRRRLSYPNVMSTLAVFIALGGGAYAATSGSLVSGTGAIRGCVPARGGTLVVVKPNNRCPRGTVALSFNARGVAGATGATGREGATGKEGAPGKDGKDGLQGLTGEPGSALGYGYVGDDGFGLAVLDAKNVTLGNVSTPETGVYCFHGLPFKPQNIQITMGMVGGFSAYAQLGAGNYCKESGAQAEVEVVDEANKRTKGLVFVLFN